jgi:RNA 3'-terminal phosphate cyclase (ATP)
MIFVDGSLGEGGGQVVRTSLSLAVLSGETLQLEKIRAGRSKPGLRPQHLTAVQAAAAICDAEVEGATLDSRALRFTPGGPVHGGHYVFDVAETAGRGSAGSVGLVLQTILLPLSQAAHSSSLVLRGGTHVPWAPSLSYLQSVFLPMISPMGVTAEVELEQWGFYPVGNGEARARVVGRAGAPLQPLELTERGSLQRVWGYGVVSNLPSHIPQRMVNRARNLLAEEGLKAELEPLRVRGAGPGASTFLFAEYEHAVTGFTAYGRKGLPAEHVAEAACSELLTHHRSGQPVDPYLADQLVLPMALAAGTSRIVVSRITHHLLTNLDVTRKFLPVNVTVDGEPGEPGTVVVTGGVRA